MGLVTSGIKVVTWCSVIMIINIRSVYCTYTCLFGNDLPLPQDARQVADCGPHETCFLEQYITPAGYVRNKVGCKDTSFCGASTISAPNVGVCSACCTGDLCATSLCGNTGWPQNTGPICYHCDHSVASPDLCDSIRICGKDEFCGVTSVSGGKYDVKCMRQAACSQALATSGCGVCCSTQLCNSKCGGQVCADDSQCQALLQTFQAAGQDICQLDPMKYFCNSTCSLCPVTSTSTAHPFTSMPTTVTLPTSPVTLSTNLPSTVANPCASNPCVHGICSVSGSSALCTCTAGFIGTLCDRTDPCAKSPCVHGVCSSLVNGAFTCTCSTGFTGALCDAATSPCSSSPCVHGTCSSIGGGYQCSCHTGYVGQLCDKTDPCSGSPCVHGVCTTLSNGTFQCTCNTGFAGPLCDKSLNPCTNSPCVHGTCSTSGNQVKCTCKQGYVGTLCDKLDPCLNSPCDHGVCTALLDGTFRCTCRSGFTGTLCDASISPCANSPCQFGLCTDTGTGFRCTCQSGYIGSLCDRPDPCAASPCMNGICSTLTNGTFQCTCKTGYNGLLCDKADPCSASPCAHGFCTSVANGTFVCTCNSGYTGLLCDRVISPCSSNPCMNGQCIDNGSGFKCICQHGFLGITCDKRDPCTLSPCVHGTCTSSQSGGFLCACSSGYTGVLCDAVISSCTTNPCIHGSCTNIAGGYMCKCDKGYTGINCDREIKDCKDIQDNNIVSATGDDVYLVQLNGAPVNVLCDMQTEGGGWTVLMNRQNHNQNFEDQDSSAYASGFGDIRENFWTGLENMHAITSDGGRYQLRIELEVANGTKYYETYDDFSVGPPKDFVLHVGSFNGNAGDSLSGHDGFGFTTKDIDRDSNTGTNCAVYLHGAWWFHNCYDSCLTCPYLTPGTNKCRSFSWNALGYCIALKSARMMVRPM